MFRLILISRLLLISSSYVVLMVTKLIVGDPTGAKFPDSSPYLEFLLGLFTPRNTNAKGG